jgi:hypothetical protein
MAKLHSHIKYFIHQVVLSELSCNLDNPKDRIWKEELLKEVQRKILLKVDDNIDLKEKFDNKVDETILEFKNELEVTLAKANKIFKNLPIEIIKMHINKNT